MLYRHFPKIANKAFSILTPSIEGLPADRIPDFLAEAAEHGINLVYTGNEPDCHKASESARNQGMSFLREFRGSTREELEAFLTATGSGKEDLLLIRLENDGALQHAISGGILSAAQAACVSGRLLAYGFSVPDGKSATLAAEAHTHWSFWSTPCSYLNFDLLDSLPSLDLFELGFIPCDPFAGGLLENPPPAVHEIFRQAPVPRSKDEWALRVLWESQDTVSILWKPSSIEDLARKAIFAEAGRPNSLPSRELDALRSASDVMKKLLT